MSVGGFHQHELLDEVSFQESMDFSSNTLKHLMAPLKQVENITTSMEQTSMMKESDSMNDIIEESKRLMEENKRVIQTVQERMIKFDNANNANNTAHPVGTPQVSANTNSTSSKITLDAMNLSAIEPTSTSPHSFSIGSISTVSQFPLTCTSIIFHLFSQFGEMSAHRRTFSPIKELLRKPSLGGAPSSGPSINTAPLPPSIALPNMSRKRSTSIEQQPTPRDVLNLSVISRSNSVHCLPTPTSFGGTFSRSETPLMMFESSNAMGGKITPQPVGVSLVRSTSTGANLAEVNNAWATEYINMLQESTKSASITPAVQFPLDRTAVRSSKDSGSVAGIDHRKFSITDSEVEYINSNQNSQQNHSSSTLMDDSGGNDSSNPLNIAMIRSGNSSLAIFSTSAGPSTITLPIANEDGEPFTPLSVSSPLPPPSMTNTTQSTSSAVPPMILMPSTSLTNPISLMDIRMSHGENKENMSPLGIVAGMSGSRSPFFPSGVTVRTPLQTIKEERGIVSIAMNSSSVEEENENDENQPPLSQLENGSAVVTSEGVSSSEVELENNTVDNATTQGTSLNEAFLKDSLVTMTSNPSNNSEVASEMMMISASAMHQNDSNGVAETRSRLFSTTAFDLTITPSKIHQDSHDDEVSVEESDNEEEEEGENEQEDENNDVVLPKQVNTSFELEPRKLSTIPSMIPTTSHHNLPMPLFPTTHHVKALDYESIEKMSIGRSTSMSSGRGSGQRSIGSSVTRSTNRRSPAPITMTAETDLSLPMSVALPTILPSVPIPPLHNNYLRDQEEEDGLVMDDSRRLVDRIEMSDDVVNVQDDESDEEVVDDEANENEERIKEEIVEEEHQHEEMMSSSLPYVNDDDDSSMIEMNGSLHSFDANVLLSMSNRSMELPLPSPITTVYQRKTVAPIPSNITEGSERSKISDDGEDAVIGGDVISELIKGICEVESTLTKAEQSSEGKKSSETSGRSSPVKMRRMMMMAPSMKLLTPTTSDYSLNNSNTAPISISSHPFPASYPTKPAVELSAISSEGMVDRSSTSYTSSVDELATYNTMSLPSLAVDAMMNNIPIRRGSFPSNAVLPPQVSDQNDDYIDMM